jgi:predicted DNA-binding transcriptional regulator YafY
VRTFRADRITRVCVAPRPGEPDFVRPEGLDLVRVALRSPWTFQIEPPTRVILEATPELAHLAREDFGEGARRVPLPMGGVRIEMQSGNPGYVTARVLAAAGRLRVIAPPSLRARVRQAAAAAARPYAEAAE